MSGHDTTNPGNQLHGLYKMLSTFVSDDAHVVEVGSFEGVSTELLARYCHQGKIWSIDPYEKAYEIDSEFAQEGRDAVLKARVVAAKRLKSYENVKQLILTSAAAVGAVTDRTLDLVYIDGDHRRPGIRFDLRAWMPKLVDGGVLAGHDYGDAVIKEEVDEFLSEVHTFSDGTWAARITY